MGSELIVLTLDARKALVLSQKELGELLGASRRTVQRWDSGRGGPSGDQLASLARAVHPVDAPLAKRIAVAAGTTLDQLGLVNLRPVVPQSPQASPPPPPALPPSSPSHLTDAVVCAAAEALNVPPPAVRPALLAAFRRAREVGLRLEDVERVLSDAIERPRAAKGNVSGAIRRR